MSHLSKIRATQWWPKDYTNEEQSHRENDPRATFVEEVSLHYAIIISSWGTGQHGMFSLSVK